MILFDQHLHSRYSADSAADPEDNCRVALERGLGGITFTDHLDCDDDGWGTGPFEDPTMRETIAQLRETYGDRLFIGLGVEIGYKPGQMDRIIAYLAERSFDLVILSIHEITGRMMSDRRQWADFDTPTATRGYLEEVLDAVRFCRSRAERGRLPFDVLGHLDLVKRYTRRYCGGFDIRAHTEIIDEILRTCLEAELVPEINTSTWRQQLSEPMPAAWIVERYAAMGGTAITLGSDAHRAADIGAGLSEAAHLCLDAGIRTLKVFRRRQPERMELSPTG